MTELETLERAKMYLEKLANGINPIDGSVIPDGDIVNHVRISRCFFYVSDVLRQVIENGGVTAQKRDKKETFSPQSQFPFRKSPNASMRCLQMKIWPRCLIPSFGTGWCPWGCWTTHWMAMGKKRFAQRHREKALALGWKHAMAPTDPILLWHTIWPRSISSWITWMPLSIIKTAE